ncbi:MAG: amino acid/amide transporter rane protein 1, family [Nocardioides sp.]|nr:amino acid/amide transporter rane protein 1, family [Nocardioides sp.]
MSQILEYVVQGLLLGSAYGLVALPISIVYTTTHSVDAAVGSHAVVAATTAAAIGGPIGILAGVGAGLATTALVGVVYLLLKARGPVDPITIVLATFGIAFGLQAMVLLFHGRAPVVGQSFARNWDVLGISVNRQSALNMAFGLVVMTVIAIVLARTSLGRSLRACADNALGAQLAGLSIGRLQFTAIMLGGGLASVSGILLLYTTGVTYTSGLAITLTAIGAAVMFGFKGPIHGFAGGLLFGVVQSLVAGYADTGLASAIPYLFIFVLLAVGRSIPVVSRP